MPSKIKQLLKLLLLIIMVLPLLANIAYGEECTGPVRPTTLHHKESSRLLEIRRSKNRSIIVGSNQCRRNCEFYMIVYSRDLYFFYEPNVQMFLCYNSGRKQIVPTKWPKFLNDTSMCHFSENVGRNYSGYIELVNTYNNTKLTLNKNGRVPNCSNPTKHPTRHCSKGRRGTTEFIRSEKNLTSCSDATRRFCAHLNNHPGRKKAKSSFKMCNDINQ